MTPSSLAPRLLVTVLIVATVVLGPAVAWALTATLTIPSLCAGPIAVLAFSTETSNTSSVASGGGAGTGTSTIKPLVLTKAIDDCSPLLFKAAFTGQHFPAATLQVSTKNGAGFFTIQLTNGVVVNLKTDFMKAVSGDDVLAESLTLDAEAFSFTSGGTTVGCNQQTVMCQ